MLWLGDSARFKIVRAVQLHCIEPPISPATDQFTPFFQFLSEGVEDHWQVQQQYSSCKWAAPKNEPLATSMLLHFGWVPKYKERMRGCCIYQMRRAQDGIHLILSEPHTYNDRLYAACARAAMIANAIRERKNKPPFELLFREACRVFFTFNGYYISVTAAYRQAAINKIQAYCLHLNNALDDTLPTTPTIDEPEDKIPIEWDEDYDQPKEYIMKWEDFTFEERTNASQKRHIDRLADDKNWEALLAAWKKLPNFDGEYTFAELTAYMSKNVFTRAKAREYLIQGRKEGRKTFWKLNYERS